MSRWRGQCVDLAHSDQHLADNTAWKQRGKPFDLAWASNTGSPHFNTHRGSGYSGMTAFDSEVRPR